MEGVAMVAGAMATSGVTAEGITGGGGALGSRSASGVGTAMGEAGGAGAEGAPKPSFSRQLRSGAGAGAVASGAGVAAGAEGAGDGSAAVFFLKKLNMLEGGLRRYIM